MREKRVRESGLKLGKQGATFSTTFMDNGLACLPCQVFFLTQHSFAFNEENRLLVTDEPVEFEKSPVDIQDFTKITHHRRGIYKIYPNFIKKTSKIRTCNRQTWKH
jgi:hypothetical protein